jgi:uncharacterized LabA/DUF88 family protein
MRISIFVDGSNMYFQGKEFGWQIDLVKLIGRYAKIGTVVDACYFVAVVHRVQKSSFLVNLPRTGFSLISKPLKTSGSPDHLIRKGNMDVEITIGILSAIDTFDMAVLASGDGDFAAVIDHLRAHGKAFQVLSHDERIGTELRDATGLHFVKLSSVKSDLVYEPSRADDLEDFEELFQTLDELPEICPK